MASAFTACAHLVLREEGGFIDDPKDPGGRTNLGITAATLAAARESISSLPASVDDLTLAQAIEIYRPLYWDAARCDELPRAAALLVFDAAVQHGPRDAVKFLQHALTEKPDGDFGPKTLAAVRRVEMWAPVLDEMVSRRLAHYMNLDAIDQRFGLGWARRVVRMMRVAWNWP